MKKLLLLSVALILLLCGCVEDKEADAGQAAAEPVIEQTEQSAVKSTVQPSPAQTAAAEPTQSPDQEASAEQTKEELEDLSDLLKELTSGEFSDIDYSE